MEDIRTQFITKIFHLLSYNVSILYVRSNIFVTKISYRIVCILQPHSFDGLSVKIELFLLLFFFTDTSFAKALTYGVGSENGPKMDSAQNEKKMGMYLDAYLVI